MSGVRRPVFVIGCGRSGTTLLYELLSGHPDLAWISNFSQRAPRVAALAALSRRSSMGVPEKGSQPLVSWRPHPVEGHRLWDWCTGDLPGGPERPLTEDDLTPESSRRLRSVVSGHVRWQGGARFLNKNTRNTRRIRYLLAAFPDATFVHVVRDPRDTALSLSRVAFWPDLPIWWADGRTPADLVPSEFSSIGLAAEFWNRELACVLRDRAHVPAGQFHEVHYEAVLRSPVAAVGELLDLLRLTYPSSLRDEVERRIDGPRPGRSPLTDSEREEIERRCGEMGRRHGYDLP